MQQAQSEFLTERPWETPMVWEQIKEKKIFEMSIFEVNNH
jgi:hypothetical protein